MFAKIACLLLLVIVVCVPRICGAEDADRHLSVMHYFADDLGQSEIEKILARFMLEKQLSVVEKPVGHEDFKYAILQLAAEGQLPDVASYWAGSRTQFLVDNGSLTPLSDLWERKQYDRLILPALAAAATRYNGERYLIPFGCHVAGIFYNPKVLQQVGVTTPPATWQEFLLLCEKLQTIGIKPLALGAKNRWPAQFWFDYLLLRTAGPEFRQKLMTGAVSYRDPQVVKVMELWADLLTKDYFTAGTLATDWNDAADLVSSGRAAMTLMGTWITGYWQKQGLMAGVDFDFMPFPEIVPAHSRVLLGTVDGLVIGANSKNRAQAEQLIDFLFTDRAVQESWIRAQGTLSPNRQISKQLYSRVMTKVLLAFEQTDNYVFNYDLATSPPVAELGLSMFSRFLAQPKNYVAELDGIADMAAALLSSRQHN